jgi:hypothetical protein
MNVDVSVGVKCVVLFEREIISPAVLKETRLLVLAGGFQFMFIPNPTDEFEIDSTMHLRFSSMVLAYI